MVLLDLARMRTGRLYQRAASPDTMAWLSDKYEYTGSVGDQVGGRMVVRVLQFCALNMQTQFSEKY